MAKKHPKPDHHPGHVQTTAEPRDVTLFADETGSIPAHHPNRPRQNGFTILGFSLPQILLSAAVGIAAERLYRRFFEKG